MNQKDKFDLINFLPERINIGKQNKISNLEVKQNNNFIYLSYKTDHYNLATKEHKFIIPQFINKNNETFEVLGLLQAEMGKTQNGCLTFANSEPIIINKVITWFEKEFDISESTWKWYIALNIQEPSNKIYKREIENKLIKYWIEKTPLKIEQSHPKKISYRKVKHTTLRNDYYGCLMIEFKNNLFSQIFKRFLKSVTYNLTEESKENIKYFMRSIIAGEGTIAYHPESGHYGVHISASEEKEREIYKNCLSKLDIELKIYDNYKEMLISDKENLIQLLKQKLVTLHPRKYNKFLNMMIKHYPDIRELGYFNGKGKNVWNKIPQEKINQILEMYNSGITRTKDIAKKLEVSIIKVNRVLKENNLGKRLVKTNESKRKEIAEFAEKNPQLTQEEIAERFNVHNSIVRRSIKKYKINRGNKSRCTIPEDKIQKIIELYNKNPTIKFSEISKEIGVSDSVIKRVRREYNLGHLGYKHLVGCNNPSKS